MLPNPTFKRPNGIPPPRLRTPSPPRDYIEPLSPAKPTPIEPNFNYPALNGNIHFAVQPEASYTPSSKARAYSTNHKSGHQRTPSTMDALAEAALAISPTHPTHSTNNSAAFEQNGYAHVHPAQRQFQEPSEPPHKRSRSELLPSPMIGQHASRPATSYELSNGWAHQAQHPHLYNSRVEEAALLLNFRSGGWPGNAASVPLAPAPAARPHANSFPQSVLARPGEAMMQYQPAPYPTFGPHEIHQMPPTYPPPELSAPAPAQTYHMPQVDPDGDVEMQNIQAPMQRPNAHAQLHQSNTHGEDVSSRAQSTDVSISETSEAPKTRRGWPKGKPRGPGGRKSLAEKAVKKATSRKKTTKKKRDTTASDWPETQEVRRKSLSDAPVFGEHSHDGQQMHRAASVPYDTPMMVRETSPSKAVRRKPAVNPETICAGCETSRETAKSHGELDEWIACNACKKWYHVDCAGFKKVSEIRDVDKYFCAACESEHGKTTYVRKSTRAHASVDYAELQRGVLKAGEESMEHHYIQPIKDGTFQFDPESFPRMRPEMVTKDFFEKSGTFTEPICIPADWNPRPWSKGKSEDTDMEGGFQCEAMTTEELLMDEFEYNAVQDHGQDELDMIMPEGLTIRHVCNLVGPDTPIDVIDVKTQNSGAKWTLSRWADYYEQVDEKEIRNVISLEVSQTKLGRFIQRPKIARDIDLQDDVWPQEEIDKGKFPKVQFYCLMSVADSYTDFHIDFGGSSVYYHILKGKKTFFFIPPKPKHLKAYEDWNDSPQQNYTFLPHITKECYRVDLSEGDTMLIPSGWIHAVWTPEDSLVIGGNFLNRMSYKNQFRVVDIEKANETPMKFRYPFFQKIMWYTAIKYLKDDPLPVEVSEQFYDGQRFDRAVPIWADFNGDIAANDFRPGAQNARFYGQAEVEGLPELVNFIFRTVMLTMGRVEGVSADRIKRVNTSIPKGYGEPLEIAKTFALWVAWKRGNEDPPAWAHPDAVLPNSKEEGPPKKLSEKKLKDLERREAIAAWRVAPDRQSARVMEKNATAAANASATAPSNSNPSPPDAQPEVHQMQNPYYQNEQYGQPQATVAPPPATFVMSGVPRSHLSTPKTSVLGPKRVACDACRKRRIRCKHKDMVIQPLSSSGGPVDGSVGAFQSDLALELHDNITVTPSKQREHMGFMSTVMDGKYDGPADGGFGSGEVEDDRIEMMNGQGPQPGTNAYVNANIPMTMNGVAMFGELPKKGRSKACYECRKSKRRCIHDENGNVDAGKAAEPPVPRGSVASKKRQSTDEGSPLLKKKQKSEAEDGLSQSPTNQHPQMQGHGVLKPQPIPKPQQPKSSTAPKRQQTPVRPSARDEQPPIDPSLFSMYPEPGTDGSYEDSRYSYPSTDQPQAFNPQSSQSYQLPSLEQIANEVLVDMNGNEVPDQNLHDQQSHLLEQVQAFNAAHTASTGNEQSKPDESVDSAVSLPTTEVLEQNSAEAALLHNVKQNDAKANESLSTVQFQQNEMPIAHPSIEAGGMGADETSNPPPARTETSPARPKSSANDLPLWQPPAPLSHSPETVKRQPALTNGVSHGKSSSPTEATPHKRKRDSSSATPGAKTKKMKVENAESVNGSVPVDKQSIELAKMLQQEDLGLRRRSK